MGFIKNMKHDKWYNGIGKSKNDMNGLHEMNLVDKDSELGALTCKNVLVLDSATPNEPCIEVDVPNGDIYLLSKTTGKVWLKTAAGAYSLKFTNINSTGHLGGKYFNGRLYYATATKLGVYVLETAITMTIATPCVVTFAAHGLAADTPIIFLTTGALPTGITAGTTYYVKSPLAGSFNVSATAGGAAINTTGTQSGTHTIVIPSWATFTAGDTAYKPMEEQNLSLFIGDGRYVSSVSGSNAFLANSLDLPAQFRITALKAWQNDLAIGAFAGTSMVKTGIFRWNTYDPSWSNEDYIDEVGINCFMQSDNNLFVLAGTVGNIYFYNGAQLTKYKKIPNVTTGINDRMSATLDGMPLIAIGKDVYSLGSQDKDVPVGLVKEYTSTGTAISSIVAVGSQLYVAHNAGVDKISTNKATGTVVTPEEEGEYNEVVVKYKSLPAGSSIGIETKINGGAWVAQTVLVDTFEKEIFFDGGLLDCEYLQTRITLTPNGANAPVISSIETS